MKSLFTLVSLPSGNASTALTLTSHHHSRVPKRSRIKSCKASAPILQFSRSSATPTRLKEGGFVTSDWRSLPNKGILNKTPFVILVRQGNPKGIHDFPDLAKPGVRLIHPDPVSSGGAQWSVLAMYGSELVKSEKESGEADKARALQTLRAIWRNVISTPARRERRARSLKPVSETR